MCDGNSVVAAKNARKVGLPWLLGQYNNKEEKCYPFSQGKFIREEVYE